MRKWCEGIYESGGVEVGEVFSKNYFFSRKKLIIVATLLVE